MRSLACFLLMTSLARAQSSEPLHLIATVALPQVKGRIDHMSIDAKGQRLFVAALGNNTLAVIDVKAAMLQHTISGLREPQGTFYVPGSNRLYVANRADGSLRIFDGANFQQIKTAEYGENADNVRYDARENRIWVGYGSGALGALNEDGIKVADINSLMLIRSHFSWGNERT